MKTIKKFFCVLLTFVSLGSLGSCANAQNNGQYTDMDVADFRKFISGDSVQLLDVRTPDEYAEGHIKDAKNINLYDNDFLSKASASLDESRPVAVYCRSGKRSAEAALRLSEKGYKVTNLKGGITAWQRENQPTEK